MRLITFALRCSQRVIRRPQGQAETLAQAVLASVQGMQLGSTILARVLLWGLVNWWADVACLAFSLRATGITGLSFGKILLVGPLAREPPASAPPQEASARWKSPWWRL